MSNDINVITISGRLGQDPIILTKTCKIASFSLAVNDGFGDKKKTYWIAVSCFGKTAELIEKYIKKGDKLCVSGRIRISDYTGKDGTAKQKVEVVAHDIVFLSSPKGVEKTETATEITITDDDFPF
jgi:single-strand DNA-binding protein